MQNPQGRNQHSPTTPPLVFKPNLQLSKWQQRQQQKNYFKCVNHILGKDQKSIDWRQNQRSNLSDSWISPYWNLYQIHHPSSTVAVVEDRSKDLNLSSWSGRSKVFNLSCWDWVDFLYPKQETGRTVDTKRQVGSFLFFLKALIFFCAFSFFGHVLLY